MLFPNVGNCKIMKTCVKCGLVLPDSADTCDCGQPLDSVLQFSDKEIKQAEDEVGRSAVFISIIAFINLVFGIMGVVYKENPALDFGFVPFYSIAYAVIYAILSYLIYKKSVLALRLAFAFFFIDSILFLILITSYTGAFPQGGIVVRIFILFGLYKGLAGANVVKYHRNSVSQFLVK